MATKRTKLAPYFAFNMQQLSNLTGLIADGFEVNSIIVHPEYQTSFTLYSDTSYGTLFPDGTWCPVAGKAPSKWLREWRRLTNVK